MWWQHRLWSTYSSLYYLDTTHTNANITPIKCQQRQMKSWRVRLYFPTRTIRRRNINFEYLWQQQSSHNDFIWDQETGNYPRKIQHRHVLLIYTGYFQLEMGIAVTKQTELNSNEFVLKFIGKEFISPNDPFWNSFLTFNITVPQTRWVKVDLEIFFLTLKQILWISSNEQLFLETKIEPLLQQLINNNLQSRNISSLIQVFLVRASELLAATTTDK